MKSFISRRHTIANVHFAHCVCNLWNARTTLDIIDENPISLETFSKRSRHKLRGKAVVGRAPADPHLKIGNPKILGCSFAQSINSWYNNFLTNWLVFADYII
jgi:hypothetical protein